jgi:hypothetical protein
VLGSGPHYLDAGVGLFDLLNKLDKRSNAGRIALFAGIRLYATVLTVGLCLRYGLLHLPQELASLAVLAHPYVLVAAGVCSVMEFLADKVPWVDSLWDSVHSSCGPAGLPPPVVKTPARSVTGSDSGRSVTGASPSAGR